MMSDSESSVNDSAECSEQLDSRPVTQETQETDDIRAYIKQYMAHAGQGSNATALSILRALEEETVKHVPARTKSVLNPEKYANSMGISMDEVVSITHKRQRIVKNRHPKQLHEMAAAILHRWLLSKDHFDFPYPTEREKNELSNICDVTITQLNHWFTNARKRLWVPLRRKRGLPVPNQSEIRKKRMRRKLDELRKARELSSMGETTTSHQASSESNEIAEHNAASALVQASHENTQHQSIRYPSPSTHAHENGKTIPSVIKQNSPEDPIDHTQYSAPNYIPNGWQNFSCNPLNMGQNMGPNMGPNMAPNMPPNMAPNMASNMATNMGRNVAYHVPQVFNGWHDRPDVSTHPHTGYYASMGPYGPGPRMPMNPGQPESGMHLSVIYSPTNGDRPPGSTCDPSAQWQRTREPMLAPTPFGASPTHAAIERTNPSSSTLSHPSEGFASSATPAEHTIGHFVDMKSQTLYPGAVSKSSGHNTSNDPTSWKPSLRVNTTASNEPRPLEDSAKRGNMSASPASLVAFGSTPMNGQLALSPWHTFMSTTPMHDNLGAWSGPTNLSPFYGTHGVQNYMREGMQWHFLSGHGISPTHSVYGQSPKNLAPQR